MSVILWCNHRHNHAPKKGKARTVYISICAYVYLLKHLYISTIYLLEIMHPAKKNILEFLPVEQRSPIILGAAAQILGLVLGSSSTCMPDQETYQ